ncbi:MAG: YkgJ family cysteine cluster protein [Candidatus Heimdallarchaeota archaeon]|nr:MAG: YkgJ family cysteine cluster protein [Candidatus Heimdallarchaeota archaeon]
MNGNFSREKRFTCQQSGHCCCDPDIIVTLTYRDLFRLFTVLYRDFRLFLQKISFYTLDSSSHPLIERHMVLEPILTSDGKIIPGLKKHLNKTCVFYSHPNCSIYSARPLSCRNYPLAFVKENKQIISVWAKNSQKTCPGIGKGSPQSLSSIEQRGEQTLEEIEKHNNVVKELNIEERNKRPLSAREALWTLVIYGEAQQKQMQQ